MTRTLVGVVGAVLLAGATHAAAQGIVPMTPSQWESARQAGMRGEVPRNAPIEAKLSAAKAVGGHELDRLLIQLITAPFTFRVVSPYAWAAQTAQDPTRAAAMARGVASPETMVVMVVVQPSPLPTAPLVAIQDVVIERAGRLIKPSDKSLDEISVNRDARSVRGVEGVFVFPVEAFLATAPIRLLFYGSGGTAMGWDMSVADLQQLK